MKIKIKSLILSIIIGGLISYWAFFSPVIDNITLIIRAILTIILVGGSFCFWVFVFYLLIGFLDNKIKLRHLFFSIIIVAIISYLILFFPLLHKYQSMWDYLIPNLYIASGGFGFCIVVFYVLFYGLEKILKKNA